MNAKSYLRQLKKLDYMIRQREEQLEELRASLGMSGIAYDKPSVMTSKSGDVLADQIARLSEIEDSLRERLTQYEEVKDVIIGQIHQLDDDRFIDILYRRYVSYETLEHIADSVGYGYEWTCRLHVQALKAFGDRFLIKS